MGALVWTGTEYNEPFGFRVQTYKGEPHLTFFLGQLMNGSYNAGNSIETRVSDWSELRVRPRLVLHPE